MGTESININVQVIRVGIAEGAVVQSPGRIRTTGLGSCVGVVLYDNWAHYCGMVHVMLPAAPENGAVLASPSKYADTAIPWLVEELLSAGCTLCNLKAKLAGGAQMFSAAIKSDLMRIGPRNVEAVLQALEITGIPILAQDVGGNVGRTIEYDPVTETLQIRTALRGIYTI
jgi:chemotaxis protein CheD